MPNPYFQFKQFTVYHDRCAMKVTTDACLFGAWCAAQLAGEERKAALDIGAGTGLLSLMTAQKAPLVLDAVELDAEAAAQATENVAASHWSGRIQVHHSDIRHFEPKTPYEVIISNPPFYENELEAQGAGKNLAHHGHGLPLLNLLEEVRRLLANDGTAFLLLPHKREKEILEQLRNLELYVSHKVVVHPSVTHPPFRLFLTVKKRTESIYSEDVLYVKEKDGTYTERFTALLKDYYLYL